MIKRRLLFHKVLPEKFIRKLILNELHGVIQDKILRESYQDLFLKEYFEGLLTKYLKDKFVRDKVYFEILLRT